MALRPDAVRERLARLEEVVARLGTLQPSATSPWFEDQRDAWAAERGVQLGAEILLDIGNHILTAHYGASASDYEDIIAQLGTYAVIDGGLRERLKGLGGFRNILVHGYLRIDPTRVADYVRRAPADFTDFALAIRAWLARSGAG